uniref:MULE transposase domain-containing protein n=1 Tax=Romanomermis culicivorax TaxID=13658 RepID=A0A915HNR3_ROMCU
MLRKASFLGIPCCHTLLPDRRQQMYGHMFRAINNAIVNVHGRLGRVHTVLFDFESAAHLAAQDELPAVITRGCTFHFGQALLRNV